MTDPLQTLRCNGISFAGRDVSIRTISLPEAEALTSLLCRDTVLRQSLGVPAGDNPTAQGFLDKNNRWCEQTHSIVMAVVDADGQTIGTISLSKVDFTERSAGIGYWLASDRWGHGCASQAFALTMWLARTLGITRVWAHVSRENTASLRMWRRYAAAETPAAGDMLECRIDLNDTAPACARLLAALREMGFPLEGGEDKQGCGLLNEDPKP